MTNEQLSFWKFAVKPQLCRYGGTLPIELSFWKFAVKPQPPYVPANHGNQLSFWKFARPSR